MSDLEIAEHDLGCAGCDCMYKGADGKWVEPNTCLTCRCWAALAELKAERNAALARAEAVEKRIAGGRVAWASGLLSNDPVVRYYQSELELMTGELPADIRRVLILDVDCFPVDSHEPPVQAAESYEEERI